MLGQNHFCGSIHGYMNLLIFKYFVKEEFHINQAVQLRIFGAFGQTQSLVELYQLFLMPKGITGSSDELLHHPMIWRKFPKVALLPGLICVGNEYQCKIIKVSTSSEIITCIRLQSLLLIYFIHLFHTQLILLNIAFTL